MLPSRERAEALLRDAERCNPGPWGDHSRVAAHCAETIARACGDMDADKAYVLGLLHDIGRKFGVSHMRHVSDGYSYMMSLGYDEAARICLTHSFAGRTIDGYVGRLDVNDQELAMIKTELSRADMDEYDDLIQLCDALAGSDGVMDIEERMADVLAALRDLRALPLDALASVALPLHDPKRVPHVLGCSHTAAELAARFGEDPGPARRAGLLHDVTKALPGPEELMKMIISTNYAINMV